MKQRLVGAVVLVSVAVIGIPMLLDTSEESTDSITRSNIPLKPDGEFSSSIIPLGEPKTPMLDAKAARERARAARRAPAGDAPPAPRSATASTESGDAPRSDGAPKASGAKPKNAMAWAVQLGSFSNSKNAIALRDRLRAKGYTAFVESAYSDSGALARVYVGPELERAKAVAAVSKLFAETKLKGIVVRYPGG